jgi:hypothetical protein
MYVPLFLMRKMRMSTAVKEVSVERFREGLFRLAGENQSEADQLFEQFKKNLIEDVTLSINAKKKGKTEAQILFERMKSREGRKHYKALRRNLGARPANTAAHHVVSWYDSNASEARQILRQFGIDIDSTENGVYLPRFLKDVPHPDMPDAYAHSSVHTKAYYLNITDLLVGTSEIPGATKEDIQNVLRDIALELQSGTYPLSEVNN